MKDMKKDEKIERAFREYFDGNEAPVCDLTQAKRALGTAHRRRGGRIAAAVSAAACFLLVAAVAVGLLLPRFLHEVPSEDAPSEGDAPQTYALASAQAENMGTVPPEEEYGALLAGLSAFSGARNASAAYTLYRLDGVQVLLAVHLEYVCGLTRWRADVAFDLTSGELLPEEWQGEDFSQEGSLSGCSYAYRTDTWNGEPLFNAEIALPQSQCRLAVTGRDEAPLFFLLRLLTENV